MNFNDRINQLYNWAKGNDGVSMIIVTNPESEKPKQYTEKLVAKLFKDKSFNGMSFLASVSIILCRVEFSNGVVFYIAESEDTVKEVLSQVYLDWQCEVDFDGNLQMRETFFHGDLARTRTAEQPMAGQSPIPSGSLAVEKGKTF